VMSIVRG